MTHDTSETEAAPQSDPDAVPSGVEPESTAESQPAASPVSRVQYLRSFGFVFRSRKWGMNLLLGSVCMFIPTIGQILLFGYLYEIIESLHRGRRDGYPDFDFKRFTPYLKRGVWPWLIFQTLFTLLFPVIFVFTEVGMFGTFAALASGTSAGAIVAAVLVPVFLLGLLGFSLLLGIVLTPLTLRAALSQDFATAFNFKWLKSFIGSMWIELALVNLFMMVASPMLAMAGYAFFCIGVWPAMVIASIAYCFLLWQLYELFLLRGGEPVPLKPPPQPPDTPPQPPDTPSGETGADAGAGSSPVREPVFPEKPSSPEES